MDQTDSMLRQPSPPSDFMVWDELDAADTPQHPDLLDRLLDWSVDGVTIRGVFSPEEVQRALAGFEGTEDMRTQWRGGSLLGMSLGIIGSESTDRTPYYDDIERCRAVYLDAFGFDPDERLVSVLSPLSQRFRWASLTENGRKYNPGQMRWYEPNLGGLVAHAGNEFTDECKDGAMSQLVNVLHMKHHLSYFIVMQKPDLGGSLSVFDLVWENYSEHPIPFGSADRDDRWFDSVRFAKIDAEPGDLVLFVGGRRWHRVEPILGGRPRITYGGFAARSRTADEVYRWA